MFSFECISAALQPQAAAGSSSGAWIGAQRRSLRNVWKSSVVAPDFDGRQFRKGRGLFRSATCPHATPEWTCRQRRRSIKFKRLPLIE
jgi:hypothetical protein